MSHPPVLSALATEMADALTAAGMPSMPSRVFGALIADDEGRMTATDLQDALAVSAGAVSGAVGYLERVGLLRRGREPGSRRDVYVVQEDAWHDAMLAHDTTYRPLIAALDRGIAARPADSPARTRLELSREFLVWLGVELDALAERWEQHKESFLHERT